MNKIEKKAKELIEAFELHELIKKEDYNETTLSYEHRQYNEKSNACRIAIKHISLLKDFLNKNDLLFYKEVEAFIIDELKHLL